MTGGLKQMFSALNKIGNAHGTYCSMKQGNKDFRNLEH